MNADTVHFTLGDSLVLDGKLSADEITGTFTDDGAKGFHSVMPDGKSLQHSAFE